MADYVQMWKDLGMDLETHDLLCQVLPTAVGDVFMSQENRPTAMDFWDMVISEVHGIRPAELLEAQKQGRKVFGTFGKPQVFRQAKWESLDALPYC